MKYCLHIVLLLDAGNVYFPKFIYEFSSILYAFIVLDIIAKSKKLIVSHFQRITPFVRGKTQTAFAYQTEEHKTS